MIDKLESFIVLARTQHFGRAAEELGVTQPTLSAAISVHEKRLGRADEIPFLADQTRLTFARCGITDPLSLADYEANGGLAGLRNALAISPLDIVKTVTESGLRGRGGRDSRLASSGRPCTMPSRLTNTSFAMPMRAIPPPSPTA